MEKVNDGQDTVVESSQDLRHLVNGDAASILAQSDIAAIVSAIFNVPVLTNKSRELSGGRVKRRW